jgi:transposase
MRYEFSEHEWTAIKPMLPNRPRGVRRVDDRNGLDGIVWALRSGARWRDLPATCGHSTACYDRFVRRCWTYLADLPDVSNVYFRRSTRAGYCAWGCFQYFGWSADPG